MKWIDIGVNLTNARFKTDWQNVVSNAADVGVEKLIITGTNLEESQMAMMMAKSDPTRLYSTAGCHPHDAKHFDKVQWDIFKQLLNDPQVVAVGECGLDFNRNFSTPEYQINAFTQQLELAVEIQKPVFLHEREAFDTQYQILKDFFPKLKGAVAHCFTGNQKELEAYLDLGLSIGITGWICDERRGQDLHDIVKLIPDNRLMIETDAPYLTPRTLTGKHKKGRNEPKFLPHIAETIAAARGQNMQHLSQVTYTNTCDFFQLKQ
ncbi:MAG: TatD family hydrolase [Gammaproteobacteria bacterium]|nr:TatD family hydrolase [Gammaproteobacteria bacterium]MDH5631298.1 TatD family hydrolase [Gammaproteobacteria bacterium]